MTNPAICLINFDQDVQKRLAELNIAAERFDIGRKYALSWERAPEILIYPDGLKPENPQEYPVQIFNCDSRAGLDLTINWSSGSRPQSQRYFLFKCAYNSPHFDSRPYLLRELLSKDKPSNFVRIVFCGDDDVSDYTVVHYPGNDVEKIDQLSYFGSFVFRSRPLKGKQIHLTEIGHQLVPSLGGLLSSFEYRQVLSQESMLSFLGSDSRPYSESYEFYCLLANDNGQMVGEFVYRKDKAGRIYDATIALPQTTKQAEVIDVLLREFLPGMMPSLFPEEDENKWRDDPAFYLPGEKQLHSDIHRIQEEKAKEIEKKEAEITSIRNQYQFVIDCFTQTGDDLKFSLKKMLASFGFQGVQTEEEFLPKGMDPREDLRIPLSENRKLLIECKGVGGTSVDEDCRQIGKIVTLYLQENAEKGVIEKLHGVYIVNSEMHMNPNSRKIVPFKDAQIKEAIGEKRSMVSTKELFRAFQLLSAGLVSQEDIQQAFLKDGVIEFWPTKAIPIKVAEKSPRHDKIFGLIVGDTPIGIGDTIVSDDGWLPSYSIVQSLQVDHKDVPSARNCEVGVGADAGLINLEHVYLLKKKS